MHTLLSTLWQILSLPQTTDWEEAKRLRSSPLNLDDHQQWDDIYLVLERASREGDKNFRHTASMALKTLEKIIQGGGKKAPHLRNPPVTKVSRLGPHPLVDLTALRLPADSSWPHFIAMLEDHGFSERERAQLTLFISRRPELAGVDVRKMPFVEDEKDLLKRLLGFPDIMERNSPSSKALALFLKYYPSSVDYDLLEFPHCRSMAILDYWVFEKDDVRSNAWIFLDKPEDLSPALSAIRQTPRLYPVTHVQLFSASPADKMALEKQVHEWIARGVTREIIPHLKEMTFADTELQGGDNRLDPPVTEETTHGKVYNLETAKAGRTKISARNLTSLTMDDIVFQFDNIADREKLHQIFQSLFSKEVTINDFISVFESPETGLVVESVTLTSQPDNTFETRVVFHNGVTSTKGEYTCQWIRKPDGHLIKTQKAWLDMGGAGHGTGITLQSRLAQFSRKCGVVDEFWIRSRGAGKHAYRFMDGVDMEEEALLKIAEKLGEWAGYYGVPLDKPALADMKSPKKLAEFVTLRRIERPWMDMVDFVLMQTGYEFTVDQVVDIARRPGLVALLSLPEYAMKLNVNDDLRFKLFTTSIEEGKTRRALPRLKGVFGGNFNFLPSNVRNALIVFRPYLFPRPDASPTVPDFKQEEMPQSPFKVTGMRSQDDEFIPADPIDPEGTPMRDYRKNEALAIVEGTEKGTQIFTATGLSGAGKTEMLIWNLERELSQRGHRVVSLDAMRLANLLQPGDVDTLLEEINRTLQPTIMIFDESAYMGRNRDPILRFSKRFLEREGQHIIFVGGGRVSPEVQKQKITELMEPLFTGSFRADHVTLLPKPINLTQAWRFLGLGRIDWMTEKQKMDFLKYLFEKIPPYFIPVMNLRLHEHPEIRSMEELFSLVDKEVDPRFWREELGLVFEEATITPLATPSLPATPSGPTGQERGGQTEQPTALKIVGPQNGGKKDGPNGTPQNSASQGLILGAKLLQDASLSTEGNLALADGEQRAEEPEDQNPLSEGDEWSRSENPEIHTLEGAPQLTLMEGARLPISPLSSLPVSIRPPYLTLVR